MAKSIFGLQLSNDTVELFRAWGSELSAQIGTILTRVPQTNDIDWVTVNLPSSGSYGGSEVYRFNDTLQATAPIFIRLDYGSQGSVNPKIAATIGKSVNGSGVVGGVLRTSTIISGGTAASSVENCYIFGDGSTFVMSLAPSSTSRGGYFLIERSVNSGGTPTGDALLIGYQDVATATPTHLFIDYVNATTETVVGGIIAMPLPLSTDRSIANGTTTPVFPAACISPGGVFWRPRAILGTARQNAGLGEIINGLLDGNGYLSLGAGSQQSDQRNSTYATTMIRWV